KDEQATEVEPVSHDVEDSMHSTFPRRTKLWIIGMITISGFLSPLSLNIYFPVLPVLARDLGVTVSLINLSVTSYQIIQALAPMFFGNFGDTAGRRPAFIICLAIYIGANIGLAFQRNYTTLLVLRGVQSFGISGTLAQCYAVVADMTTTSERGKYMGIVGMGMTVGPGLGLLLGGLLTQYFSWPSVFWFCLIVAAAWVIPYILFVPETCRQVVGNGSVSATGWNRTVMEWLSRQKDQTEHQSQPRPQKRDFHLPNPLPTLVICLQKDMSMILLFNAILFASIFMVLTTASTSFVEQYGLSQIQVGLCYLPYGVACCITAMVQGRILDWNYQRIANKIDFTIDRRRGDNLRHYPIERCRLELASPIVFAGVLALVGYGWAIEANTTLAVPVLMIFFVGLFLVGGHTIMNILIVDLYPQSPATAIAANNLTRCLLSAGGSAVVKLMVDAMGHGWCFTLVGGVLILMFPVLYVLVKKGPGWREERRVKLSMD
ncbi:hypothetical protein LB503_002642, partial [Fusarium chuoi]